MPAKSAVRRHAPRRRIADHLAEDPAPFVAAPDFDAEIAQLAIVLGAPIRTAADVPRMVARGLPAATLGRLIKAGFNAADLDLVIPARTRRFRVARGQPLSPAESDGVLRLARLLFIAHDVFADSAKAARWLRAPSAALGGVTPLSLAATEAGGRVVENLLAKIRWGAAA